MTRFAKRGLINTLIITYTMDVLFNGLIAELPGILDRDNQLCGNLQPGDFTLTASKAN